MRQISKLMIRFFKIVNIKKTLFLLFLIPFCIEIKSQVTDDFVFIKGGKFKMGYNKSNDEQPIHKVIIDDFYILDHEVTNSEYAEFLNEKGNQYAGNTKYINLDTKWKEEKCKIYKKDSIFYVEKGFEDYPVVFVSWWGAQAYSEWSGGRLPYEAEWEYLAKVSFGKNEIPKDTLDLYCVYSENSDFYTKVKSKKPKLGIYDLFGNLSEWCYDWYSPDYYRISPKKNPTGAEKGRQKIKRGGSWVSLYKSINQTNRKATNPNNHGITIGFRVVIPK